MTERELVTGLRDVLVNENLVSLYAFVTVHAERLGVALPENWPTTAEKEAREAAADAEGWPR